MLVALLVAVAALKGLGAWQRRQLIARLRSAWGNVPPPRGSNDDHVAEAWRESCSSSTDDAAIDKRTWDDLDLDSVLTAIDRTHTALGRQLLYWRMRSGTAWKDSPTQEELTNRFGRESDLREAVGVQLASTGRSLGNGIWVITRPELIVIRWWYWFFPLLTIGMLACLAAVPFYPRALVAALAIVVFNMVVRMATAWHLPELLAPMRQIGPLIRTAERLARVDGVAPSGIAADVRRLRSLRRIAKWVSRDPLASGEIMSSIWEYLNLMFILDANAFLLSARQLRQLGPVLARVALWVGNTDAAWSVASLRAEPRRWSVPSWSVTPRTRAQGVWHPLIDAPVTNDVDLHVGHGIVITGSNMSGKTTYLRAVGIAAVLARSINTCPAASWTGRSFRVRSLIGRNDDLSTGKSYYQVEADGVVGLLGEATDTLPTLFLLDELLRGTNTIERLAAGEAVLRALLAEHNDDSTHVVIVATHDGELVSMLRDLYVPVHFRETIGDGGLAFDYRRHDGPASTRTAIALLEATGAPRTVVESARIRAAQLDADRAG